MKLTTDDRLTISKVVQGVLFKHDGLCLNDPTDRNNLWLALIEAVIYTLDGKQCKTCGQREPSLRTKEYTQGLFEIAPHCTDCPDTVKGVPDA
jgi:hypothetical protein